MKNQGEKMVNNFTSKYNIGLSVTESLFQDITIAFNHIEKGAFDRAFSKLKTVKGKIPIKKISERAKKHFKALDSLYCENHKIKNKKMLYKIIVKYHEILIEELDRNNMYLPSLKDMSNFV